MYPIEEPGELDDDGWFKNVDIKDPGPREPDQWSIYSQTQMDELFVVDSLSDGRIRVEFWPAAAIQVLSRDETQKLYEALGRELNV